MSYARCARLLGNRTEAGTIVNSLKRKWEKKKMLVTDSRYALDTPAHSAGGRVARLVGRYLVGGWGGVGEA